jgi:hypothetical protein
MVFTTQLNIPCGFASGEEYEVYLVLSFNSGICVGFCEIYSEIYFLNFTVMEN